MVTIEISGTIPYLVDLNKDGRSVSKYGNWLESGGGVREEGTLTMDKRSVHFTTLITPLF